MCHGVGKKWAEVITQTFHSSSILCRALRGGRRGRVVGISLCPVITLNLTLNMLTWLQLNFFLRNNNMRSGSEHQMSLKARSSPCWSVALALKCSQPGSYTWQPVYSAEEFSLRPQVNQFQPAAARLVWNTSESPHCSRSSSRTASGISSLLCISTPGS